MNYMQGESISKKQFDVLIQDSIHQQYSQQKQQQQQVSERKLQHYSLQKSEVITNNQNPNMEETYPDDFDISKPNNWV